MRKPSDLLGKAIGRHCQQRMNARLCQAYIMVREYR